MWSEIAEIVELLALRTLAAKVAVFLSQCDPIPTGVEGAAHFARPFWLVATIIIGPFCWWLYAPLFRRHPSDLREDTRGCPPSLLDLLLEQTPQFRMRAAGKAAEAAARQPGESGQR